MKKLLLFIAIIAIFILYVMIKSFFQFRAEEQKADVFKPYLDQYLNFIFDTKLIENPYLNGKLLTLDIKNKRIDDLTFPMLNETVKADSPEKVKTLVLIEWYTVKEGEYFDERTGRKTGNALRSCANISVIDMAIKAKIYQRTFYGNEPLKTFHGEGDFTSMQPIFEIVDFIHSLPRK